MDKLKYIKLENEDGSYSSSIPLAVDSNYVDVNGSALTNVLGNKANNADIDNLQSQINSLASGSPLVASSTSGMIDITRVYVNTTDGYWYYYNGSQWTAGGVYQAAEDSDAVNELREDLDELEEVTTITEKRIITPTIIENKRITVNGTGIYIGDDNNCSYYQVDVIKNEKYYFSGRWTIYISGVIFVDGNNQVISTMHYNTSTENVVDYEILVPANCTMYINFSKALEATLKRGILLPKTNIKIVGSNTTLIVDINGNGDFTSISEACLNAENGDTILIYPGTYREQVNIYGKELHLVGINKYECILIDSSSDYRTPPLQANWGSISNMTIIEDASNPAPGLENVTYDGHPVKDMAYCIHSDNGQNIWTTTHTEFVVENCILKNANRPCIGAGLYPYHTLKIINCEMESGVGVAEGYKRGCLYYHNNTSTSGVNNQQIIIKDNIIKCDDDYSLYAYDTGGVGTCTCELINNTFYSAINGVSENSIFNQMGKNKVNFKLFETCNGNNIASLNY